MDVVNCSQSTRSINDRLCIPLRERRFRMTGNELLVCTSMSSLYLMIGIAKMEVRKTANCGMNRGSVYLTFDGLFLNPE